LGETLFVGVDDAETELEMWDDGIGTGGHLEGNDGTD